MRRACDRSYAAPSRRFIDTTTGAPAYGSYAGLFHASISVGCAGGQRIARRKKLGLRRPSRRTRCWISMAIVRTGYAATAFAVRVTTARIAECSSTERSSGRRVGARRRLTPRVRDSLARFRLGPRGIELSASGATSSTSARASASWSSTRRSTRPRPRRRSPRSPRLGAGLASTRPRSARSRPVRGGVERRGPRASRSTAPSGATTTRTASCRGTREWRWAFAMGRAQGGAPSGSTWSRASSARPSAPPSTHGRVHPLAEPRFDFDAARPERCRGGSRARAST